MSGTAEALSLSLYFFVDPFYGVLVGSGIMGDAKKRWGVFFLHCFPGNHSGSNPFVVEENSVLHPLWLGYLMALAAWR